MSNYSADSGFQKRVFTGHLGNFLRKPQAADSLEDLDRVMQTAGLAAKKRMIEPAQLQLLREEYQRRRTTRGPESP